MKRNNINFYAQIAGKFWYSFPLNTIVLSTAGKHSSFHMRYSNDIVESLT